MPIVPLLQPSVAPAALPVPQARAVGPEAFGSGLGTSLRQAASGLAEIQAHAQEEADAARLITARRQLDDLEHGLLFDPQSGALNAKGEAVFPIYGETLRQYDTAVSEMTGKLANRRQKALFAQMAQQRREAMGGRLEEYTRSESARFFADETKAAVESSLARIGSYYDTPDEVAKEQGFIESSLRIQAQRDGTGPEELARQLAVARSAGHETVIERALSAGKDQLATEYLAAHRDEITGDRIGRLEEAVKNGTTLGEAFRLADAITSSTPDRGEALAKVRDIADPNVRQRAQAEVNQFYNEQEANHRAEQDRLFQTSAAQLETYGGNMNRLRSYLGAAWLDLDAEDRSRLEARSRQIAQTRAGIPPTTDYTVWTDFLLKSPSEMAQVNPLRDLRGSLADGDYEQAVRMVAEARQGHGATISDVLTFNDRMLMAARGAGLVPADATPAKWSEDQTLAYDAFRQRVAAAMNEAATAKGGKLTPDEKQAVIDRATIQLRLDRPFRPDKDILASTVTDEQTGHVYVPAARIPKEDSLRLTQAIIDAGGKPTQRKVERIAAVLTLSALGRLTEDEARAQIVAIAQEPVDD